MIADKTASNHVVEIISGIGPSCHYGGCNTCGGYSVFKRELDKRLPDQSEINKGLELMNSHDLELLRDHGLSINMYLEELQEVERNRIIGAWLAYAETNSKFAYGLVWWAMRKKLKLSESEIAKLLGYAVPAIVQNRKDRDWLRNIEGLINLKGHGLCLTSPLGSFDIVALPKEIIYAFRQDDLDDQKERERVAELSRQDEIERIEYLDELSHLSFYDKVKALKFGRKIYYTDLKARPNWLILSEVDLTSLDGAHTQQLIDWCNDLGFGNDVMSKLYERRHQIRLAAMNQVRVMLKNIPIEGWLTHLLLEQTTPIDHYPAELTDHATTEWLDSLVPDVRNRFLNMIKGTKLRIWKKVAARLAG